MKEKIKQKNWNDITLRKFNEIQNMIAFKDEYTVLNILGIVYDDIDFEELTLPEFAAYKNTLDFLRLDIPKNKLKKHYKLNGTTYDSNIDITKLTVSQFIDYQNFIKRNSTNYSDYISVFFIPEGHTYNDGYDMDKVREDINELPMTDVMALIFFLTVQYRALLTITPYYLKKELAQMKTEMKTEDQMKIQTSIDQLEMI